MAVKMCDEIDGTVRTKTVMWCKQIMTVQSAQVETSFAFTHRSYPSLLQGSRDSTVVRVISFSPVWLTFQCWIVHQVGWVSTLLSGCFFSGLSAFPPSTKPTLLNSNLIWKQWMKSPSMGYATASSYFISNNFSSRKIKKAILWAVYNSLSRLLQMQERSLLYSHVTWQSMLLQTQKCKSIVKVYRSACIVDLYLCRLISSLHAKFANVWCWLNVSTSLYALQAYNASKNVVTFHKEDWLFSLQATLSYSKRIIYF